MLRTRTSATESDFEEISADGFAPDATNPAFGRVGGVSGLALAIPGAGFDPKEEEILRWASGVASSRPPRRAPHLRVVLAADRGFMAYGWWVPDPHFPTRALAPSGVLLPRTDPAGAHAPPRNPELLAAADSPVAAAGQLCGPPGRRQARMTAPRVARAEIALGRRGDMTTGLDPDPLTPFALAMQDVGADEQVELALDFRALAPRDALRWHQHQTIDPPPAGSVTRDLLAGLLLTTPAPKVNVPREPLRAGRPSLVFAMQALVRAQASDMERARDLALRCGLHPFTAVAAGQGEFTLRWLRGAKFDRRWGGRFATRGFVRVEEVAGLMVPPTARCRAPNVRREVVLPEPPPGLPTWTPEAKHLEPLGAVTENGVKRAVGWPRREVLFSYTCGRTRWGKSERETLAFTHRVRSGVGGMYYDPDRDAIERLKWYLADVAHRVLEINFEPQAGEASVPGWNLLAVRNQAEVADAMALVTDSFVAAAGWNGKRAPRAITLSNMAAQSLAEVALLLPPEDAPTLFQLLTLLTDSKWRDEVVEHLSPTLQGYWKNEFSRLQPDAITPLTNLVRKFMQSPGTRTFFGSSETTYDARRCMDEGKIVLVCPAASGDEETRMLTALLFNDLVRAALSRKNVPPEERREFWVVGDEVQEQPAAGVRRGTQRGAKNALHMALLNQDPADLDDRMRKALMTNCSLLLSSAVGWDGARLVEHEMGLPASVVGNLPRYRFACIIRPEKGETIGPFGLDGLAVRDVFGPGDPEGPAKIRAASVGHRSVAEVTEALATLDGRIRRGLARLPKPGEESDGIKGEGW